MEKVKGYDYTVEGFEDMEKFALGILALVNLQSSGEDVIADIQTFEGTWKVSVTAYCEIDSYLKAYVGEISHKEEMIILKADWHNLDSNSQKTLHDAEKEKKEIFIAFEN